MTPRRRSGPPAQEAAPTNNTSVTKDTAALDKKLVGDASIWTALFDGRFRLAVRCDTCGRWLTSHRSKAAGRGPSCAGRAVGR